MSQFSVEVTILSRNGEPPHALEALVDTGAAYSVVPRSLIEFLGYRHVRAQRVILADGRLEEWPVSHVDVGCQGRRTDGRADPSEARQWAPLAARSTYREYASRAAGGRRLASGPF